MPTTKNNDVRLLHIPPPEMLRVIGEITIYWSRATMQMDDAIARLLDIDREKAYALTGAFLFNGKMEMLRVLGKLHFANDADTLKSFNGILTRIITCYEQRNDIEHALWFDFGQSGTLRAKSRKKKYGGKFESVALTDLQETAVLIARLVADMTKFFSVNIPEATLKNGGTTPA